jgi:replication initiation and membrane attachment protein DnaB
MTQFHLVTSHYELQTSAPLISKTHKTAVVHISGADQKLFLIKKVENVILHYVLLFTTSRLSKSVRFM